VRRASLFVSVAVLAGCQAETPPSDPAESRRQAAQVVMDWHRLWAEGKWREACEHVTAAGERRLLAQDLPTAAAEGRARVKDCEAFLQRLNSPQARALLGATVVDSVEVKGERATVTVHTSANLRGVTERLAPAEIPLRWTEEHWMLD
jgi:hypothetical protein